MLLWFKLEISRRTPWLIGGTIALVLAAAKVLILWSTDAMAPPALVHTGSRIPSPVSPTLAAKLAAPCPLGFFPDAGVCIPAAAMKSTSTAEEAAQAE